MAPRPRFWRPKWPEAILHEDFGGSTAERARPIAKLEYDEYSWSTEKFHTPAILKDAADCLRFALPAEATRRPAARGIRIGSMSSTFSTLGCFCMRPQATPRSFQTSMRHIDRMSRELIPLKPRGGGTATSPIWSMNVGGPPCIKGLHVQDSILGINVGELSCI